MPQPRRAVLAPLPFLLAATAVGVALGAVVALDVGPLPEVRSSLALPGETASWGDAWSADVVMPDEERQAALDHVSGLVGLVGAAGVLAALGAAATLLGTGASARGREVAVRAALGAGPWRLRARLLRDHALLLGLGLGGGALLGLGAILAARRTWPGGAPPLPDATLPLLAIAAAGVLALVWAVAPARAARPARLPALLAGGRSTADARETGTRRLLLVLQIGGALAVPVPALLLLAPPPAGGDEAGDDLVLADVAVPEAAWAGFLARLESDPTLVSESIASPGAWDGLGPADLVLAECLCTRGTIWVPFLGARARHHAVTAGFFAAAGIDVVEGRGLASADGARGEPVAVVSRSFARANFDGSAVGRWVRIGRDTEGFHTVVGVVEDRRVAGLATGGGQEVYLSLLQHPVRNAVASARASRPAARGAARVTAARLAAAATAAGASVAGEPRSRAEHERARLAPLRWLGAAGLALAAVALLSALAGVHAVSRLDVALRRRELAVRRALGATGGGLARWLLARRLRDLAWGGGFGLWAAVSLAALLHEAAVLPGPTRAAPFLATLGAVAAVTLLGTLRGAREAVAVPPAAAMTGEAPRR